MKSNLKTENDSIPLKMTPHPKVHVCKNCGRKISILEMEDWNCEKCVHCKNVTKI